MVSLLDYCLVYHSLFADRERERPCSRNRGKNDNRLLVVDAELTRRPSCGTVNFVLRLSGYIGEFEYVDDHRAGKIVVNLIGRLNKCGVISPRFDVAVNEIEKWVTNLLPSRQFGYIVLTTSYGIMDHEEARRKHTGGKILGFFY
jgi:small subunit ribosomal protein S15Ae